VSDELVQARLIDGHLASLERGDLFPIDVATGDVVAHVREPRARDQSDVAGPMTHIFMVESLYHHPPMVTVQRTTTAIEDTEVRGEITESEKTHPCIDVPKRIFAAGEEARRPSSAAIRLWVLPSPLCVLNRRQ